MDDVVPWVTGSFEASFSCQNKPNPHLTSSRFKTQ
jgi:hypothetical protein